MSVQRPLKKIIKEKKSSYVLEFETAELHKSVKAYCIMNGISMKDYLNTLIKKDLEKGSNYEY